MPQIAIQADRLSKMYQIGHSRDRQDTLRDLLVDLAKKPFQRNGKQDSTDDQLWALKDVSLEIKHGEVLGIIGRNGAGKSTLLKILSRITEPTGGRAIINGRVGSLLEVGTGFHPELTGRENIYLNGAILGMRRHEINRKFDEIVEFAEIEKFLDTPVKRYSSGMYVRLAFAVAAHLEPEILLIDEVLAVGDAEFQKKCLGKMGDVARGGRTVIFVSHNMQAIQRLCPNSILLDRGFVSVYGPTRDVVSKYLSSASFVVQPENWLDLSSAHRDGVGGILFSKLAYSGLDKASCFAPYSNGPLDISLLIQSDLDKSVGSLAITLYDQNGTKLIDANVMYLDRVIKVRRGLNKIKFHIEQVHLAPGIYTLGLWMADPAGEIFDHIPEALKIEIISFGSEWYGSRGDGIVTSTFEVSEHFE